MKYLLDSTVCVAVLRGHAAVADRVAAVPSAELATSTVNLMEMEEGVYRNPHPERERERIATLLALPLRVLPFDDEAARMCARLRYALRTQPVGLADVMIASVALVHDLTVVTNNVREFARVPGLRVEDWSRAE